VTGRTVTVRADDLLVLLAAVDMDYVSTGDLADLEERVERLHAAAEGEEAVHVQRDQGFNWPHPQDHTYREPQ
jgi:hypothetical protein